MAFKILVEAVDEKLSMIAPVLSRIEQNGQDADLRQLAFHLVDALSLFQRNPGIEAAADDLYAAAAALVTEHTIKPSPSVRNLRLAKEAKLRFCSRLEIATERLGPYENLLVPEFVTHQAA